LGKRLCAPPAPRNFTPSGRNGNRTRHCPPGPLNSCARSIRKRAITKSDNPLAHQFVSRKNRAGGILVSVTETFVPLRTFDPVSFVQSALDERSVRNCNVKPLKGAGHEICTRPLLIRLAMESSGNGQTVVA